MTVVVWRAQRIGDLARAILVAAVVVMLSAARAVGDEPAEAAQAGPPHFEMSFGGDVIASGGGAYSALVIAPLRSVRDQGLRFKFAGGLGRYRYSGRAFDATGQIVEARSHRLVRFTDALVGYQAQWGRLTAKLYAGVTGTERWSTPFDPTVPADPFAARFKTAAELWLDLSPALFGQLDAEWVPAFERVSGRGRLGWRLASPLSFGPEAALLSDPAQQIVRAGGFARLEWDWGEVSISAGEIWRDGRQGGAYVTAGLLHRF